MDRNTNKQMDEMLSPDDMMMPQEPPTPEAIAEGKQAAKEIFYESFPGIGEAASVARVKKELEEEDYTGAAIETAAGLAGISRVMVQYPLYLIVTQQPQKCKPLLRIVYRSLTI